MRRVQIVTTVVVVTLLLISTFFVYRKQEPVFETKPGEEIESDEAKVVMSVMANQTEKEELGRATWKFLHTMMARYPETPTESERKSLKDFMMLFSTLYPCGECATHFNKMITTYPPQTSSRVAASQWLCAMHNNVNERLKKPMYDCNDIEAKYPCGCDDEKIE
ncbi:ERV/ALR sulfhydryl oxidase domain-containing protein [Helicostylum pulchrum]|nr:ERV/ALR sulfhydryl oxidase domain-containing protein [Helicostylum pulchrum]